MFMLGESNNEYLSLDFKSEAVADVFLKEMEVIGIKGATQDQRARAALLLEVLVCVCCVFARVQCLVLCVLLVFCICKQSHIHQQQQTTNRQWVMTTSLRLRTCFRATTPQTLTHSPFSNDVDPHNRMVLATHLALLHDQPALYHKHIARLLSNLD